MKANSNRRRLPSEWIALQIIPAILFVTILAAPGLARGDDFSEGRTAYKAGNFSQALVLFEKSANSGNVGAQHLLGLMFLNGFGTAKNPASAATWFYEAAQADHAPAQTELAQLYYRGHGVEKDWKESARWFGEAAKQNDLRAIMGLAALYELGHGVDQDFEKSHDLYRRSATLGNTEAVFKLGVFAEFGRIGEPDIGQAFDWYKSAARLGHGDAYERVGYFHEHGRAGLETNWLAAADNYQKAAQRGSAWGQYRLGKMYHDGRGVAQNTTHATQWLALSIRRPNEGEGPQGAKRLYKQLTSNRSDSEESSVRRISSPVATEKKHRCKQRKLSRVGEA